MKSNRWSSAAFIVVVAASAFGLTLFRGEPSPDTSPTSASRAASDVQRVTEPVPTPETVGAHEAPETGNIVVRFPTWLDPDRMDDAVRDAGATPVDQPTIGSVVATLDEATRGDVIAKLQGDPRVEGVQTGRPQLLY